MYYDDLDIEDAEDSFCGEQIQSFKIKVSDYIVPDNLIKFQDLSHTLLDIIAQSSYSPKPNLNQFIRSFVDIYWELKPRPELYAVTESSKVCFIALKLEDSQAIASRFLAHVGLNNYNMHLSPSSYTSAEKCFFPKPNKLLRTIFKEVEASEIMLKGSPLISRFRESLDGYECVVAFDLESFEWSHELLLELGIAIYYPRSNEIKAAHLLFEENSWRRNGSIVQDSRDNFSFGNTRTLPQKLILQYLLALIKSKICLVGHAVKNDINMLLKATDEFTIIRFVDTYDTQEIHRQLSNKTDWDKLECLITEYLCTSPQGLHNAGNDAVYTLKVFLAMSGIEPSEDIAELSLESPKVSTPGKIEPSEDTVELNLESPKVSTPGKSSFSKFAKSKYM